MSEEGYRGGGTPKAQKDPRGPEAQKESKLPRELEDPRAAEVRKDPGACEVEKELRVPEARKDHPGGPDGIQGGNGPRTTEARTTT